MRIVFLLIILLAVPQTAFGQANREETFRSLGKSLQSIQNQLSRSQTETLSVGSTAKLQGSLNVFTTAQPTTSSGLMLSPNTTIKYLGDEDGYSKIVPTDAGWNRGPIYVERSDLIKKITTPASSAIEDAITRIGELARNYSNNQYVRVKGFKLSLSIPPSLDVEFELK